MLGAELTRRYGGAGPARRHDRRHVPRLGRARASARSCRAASRCGSKATPTTTSARGCRAARSCCGRRAARAFVAEENMIAGNVDPLRRDRRRRVHPRHRRRALLRAQLRRDRGGGRRRRPRLRVHDRRARGDPRPDRPQLRGGHVGRVRVRVGPRPVAVPAHEPRHGRHRPARRRRRRLAARHRHPAPRGDRLRGRRAAAVATGGRNVELVRARCSRRTTSACSKRSATRWSAASTPTRRSWRRRTWVSTHG